MMDDNGKHICPETKSEICAFHRVEIERRKTDRGGLQELKQKLEAHEAEFSVYKKEDEMSLELYKEKIYILIGKLEVFKGRGLVAGSLVLLMVLGSYTYIGLHQVAADARYYTLSERLAAIDDKALLNKENMAVLTSKLETTNDRLKEMIDLLRTHETNQRVQGVPRG